MAEVDLTPMTGAAAQVFTSWNSYKSNSTDTYNRVGLVDSVISLGKKCRKGSDSLISLRHN